ncbi:PREDICTED: uncharacterized protein LOC105448768 [Wasmannia auropunctata]|uniref:uncharacterized protein LOC105448768 n=1 Tax=Wasmannia auropunctata TaxID=64793 RepID=UPI0005EE8034|nr:PREDICTED: uncharacterized protein LOC105448768 [Wasmannia auropunctata]
MPRSTMANRRYAAFDYCEGCITKGKRTATFERRYNAANFRIPFRINWTVVLTVIVSISVCQFAESVAERQVSSSHGKKHYDRHCSVRRSMVPSQTLQSVAEYPALTPRDVLSRLEAAAVLRDNLVTTLGRVLLLCLDDHARVPFERIHDAVRNRRVAVYEFLPVLPALRNKLPKQQLYKLLQMLERVDNRFVSEYASLCINAFSDVDAALERRAPLLADMLLDIDQEVIESVSRDKRRADAVPPSLTKGIDFLLQAARDGDQILNLRTVSAILLNYPAFDLTDPEVHNAIRFIAQRLKERSGGAEDYLLQYMGPNLENATNFLKTVLERLEADELSSEAIREATSLLLQNFDVEPYPTDLNWKDNLKKLSTNDYYPVNVAAVAKYLFDRLDDSHLALRDLDIGFHETGDHALLQVLSRLRRKSRLRHLRKPLSLLIPFVSQKLASDANYDYAVPISFHEVSDYLDSFDTPCLQRNISDVMKMLRPHLSEDLPWTYAFGDRQASGDPWELMLTSLIHLRNVPVNKPQANLIDNFIYKGRVNGLTSKRGLLYETGIIFQRDDSTEVEVDFFSLLMRIPNAFKSEKFAPILNFFSKPNIVDILGYEFNKFEYETPRSLLLAMLKRVLTLPSIKSDEPLYRALQNAHNYLAEPLLINLYVSEDLQMLLKNLPYIDSDPRYLPLKILFKKWKLLTYLSTSFSLADVHTPMERLLLILRAVGLKTTQPKLLEALSFAVDSIDGPPLPIKTFDRSDFVYLVQQLLSRNKILQDEILKSYAYVNVGDWNVSISGTPENVLARALNHPIHHISSDANLTGLVTQAEGILEEEILINTEILKKQTLEAMMEYLPYNTYVKPVNLLLRKANLMALVPELNLASLEAATARDALITLLKSLTKSRIIRVEKLLLRRIRAALSILDSANEDDRQTPIFTYLIQSLQDPSNIIYQPLLLEISKLENLTISPEERQAWLENHFQQIIDRNESEDLTKAASMILREITYDESLDKASRASKERIGKAVSALPTDSFTEPLRKLLTPDWAYSILPEKLRKSDSLEKEELLMAILHYAKKRADVAVNLPLMRAISKIEAKLKGYRMDIESLKTTVAAIKAAVYDPVRKLLTAAGLNKIKVTVPSSRSAKGTLLGLLHRLLVHPVIKKNSEVFKMLSAIRQDVFSFGMEVDLLTVLDDVGVTYIDELAPVRLYLHRRDVSEKFGHTVFAVADPKRRYRTLLYALQKQHRMDNDTQLLDAFSALKNVRPNEGEDIASTQISDFQDIVNSIPHRVRQQFDVEHLFNANTLSRLTSDNEIVQSTIPLVTLLTKMTDLPEVSSNYTAANELNKLLSDVKDLSYPIVTGFQLRPLLRELGHIQQINVDYFNSILNPEILSYLNTDELFDTSSDNIEILKNIVDYLLREVPAFVDHNMQQHLQSFKRALELMIGSNKLSRRDLTEEDWKKMLVLIPHEKDFRPIKIFLQSGEILKYFKYKDTDWKMFSTPAKKLLHLLSLINDNEIENENVYKSTNKLRRNLEKRYNFITEQDVKSMHRTLMNLNFKYDLVPLKIFLNHDNMIKYLSPDFKYTHYSSSIDALATVLDNLLRSSSLRRKAILYKTMRSVRQALRERGTSAVRQSFRRTFYERLSSKDLEFVSLLNMSLPKVRQFFKPEKIASLLPESFNFDNQPTYKTKVLHLLRQLLKLDTDIHSELEELLLEEELYPDIPNITKDDLVPLLNILPQNVPYVGLIKKYLKPSTLIKLLPGNFDIKHASTPRVALHDVLLLLSITIGSTNDKLKISLDALVSELTKISSNVVPYESIIDSNDIRAIIKEIPFRYNQIKQLESRMTIKKVIASLPLNFQLTEYKTKKLRVLAVLDELSKSYAFRSSLHSIDFAKRIVRGMPDTPAVNDTEIERLLLPLPLTTFYVKLLVKNCKLATLMPHLPIYFNLSGIASRKLKVAKILYYCKLTNPTDVSTRQALINAEASLEKSPDVDVTREHVEVLIRAIPCTHFTSIKPLLRILSRTDVALLLPWNFDVYQKSRTFKQRIFDLLTALRNVKELQNDEIFSALDSLETNARSLPEQANVPQERVTILYNSAVVATTPCSDYRDFVLKLENLIQILPPNFRFQVDLSSSVTSHSEWSILMRYSALFLRDVKVDGSIKNAFKACRDNIDKYVKEQIFFYLSHGLNSTSSQQLAPLNLYALGHAEDVAVPVEDVYRAFPFGSIYSTLRVIMREFVSRPGLIKSKSLINDIEVFLHDYFMTTFRSWSIGEVHTEIFYEIPSPYEIDRAIDEIPNDHTYDDLRLLLRCEDIKTSMERLLQSEDTPKRLLLQMLELAETKDIDAAIQQSIRAFKPSLVNDVHTEEVEHALKQMRDYRYHASKMDVLRKYFVSRGFQQIFGKDFLTEYPTYRDRLFAMNDMMLNITIARPGEFSAEYRAASDHLNRTLHNEIKIERRKPRTMDDINMQSLFFALPRTRNEKIIRGIIKFFSIPDLLRKLKLPRDPFEYATKGRLLRAMMDLGQELESVQRDPVQQEALEYFRDKITTVGPGAQPIELKRYARDSNVDVDLYGVMRAIDYTKTDVTDAVRVAMFFERKYDNLVHAVGFDHMAYATRGSYLKALLEHLVNVSEVPDDVKQHITSLIPAVRLDGPGEESVDLNTDIVYEETPSMRMFGDFQDDKSQSPKPVVNIGTNVVSHTFRENKESLNAAVDNMLETISPSEEEYFQDINGNVYNSKTRVVIGAPHIARRKLDPEQSRVRGTSNTEIQSGTNRAELKKKKKDRSTKKLLLSNVNIPANKARIVYEIIKKANRIKSSSDLNRQVQSTSSDYRSDEDDNNSLVFVERVAESPPLSSQKLLSEKLPKNSHRSHQTRHKSKNRKLLIRPDTSNDVEYSDADGNVPIARILHDTLQNEKSLSLTEELMAEHARLVAETSKTVKKDLNSRHTRKRRNIKDGSR